MKTIRSKAGWTVAAGASFFLMGCDEAAGGSDTVDQDVSQAETALDDTSDTGDAGDDTAESDTSPDDTMGGDTTDPDPEPLECTLPQAPRDISLDGGIHAMSIAGPGAEAQWLCNVHFHDPLEHAGVAVCPEYTPGGDPVCAPENGEDGGDDEEPVHSGNIIEVHWVYSSCNPAETPPPEPGLGLGPCVCEGGQILRVRAQVYVVDDGENGESGLLAPPEGVPLAMYAGSTTGAKWDGACSDVAVNWEVGTECQTFPRTVLGGWCEDNVFGEHHGHHPRELITEPELLSPFSPGAAQ